MRQTVGDMLRSLLVVGAFIVVLLLVTWRPQPDAVKVVDTTSLVSLAVAQADFTVYAPTGLPSDWRATSVRWEPTQESDEEPVLHIGFVTPGDQYAQFSQSTNASAPYIAEQTDHGVLVGSQAVGDVTWERWEHGDRHSLVQVTGGGTTIVSGSASWDELIALASSLKASSPSG